MEHLRLVNPTFEFGELGRICRECVFLGPTSENHRHVSVGRDNICREIAVPRAWFAVRAVEPASLLDFKLSRSFFLIFPLVNPP